MPRSVQEVKRGRFHDFASVGRSYIETVRGRGYVLRGRSDADERVTA